MTDKEYADAVKTAGRALNEAIAVATEAGLQVGVTETPIQKLHVKEVTPFLTFSIARPL